MTHFYHDTQHLFSPILFSPTSFLGYTFIDGSYSYVIILQWLSHSFVQSFIQIGDTFEERKKRPQSFSLCSFIRCVSLYYWYMCLSPPQACNGVDTRSCRTVHYTLHHVFPHPPSSRIATLGKHWPLVLWYVVVRDRKGGSNMWARTRLSL